MKFPGVVNGWVNAALEGLDERISALEAAKPEGWSKEYPCGCSASGGHGLPDYCPDHGVYVEAKPEAPASEIFREELGKALAEAPAPVTECACGGEPKYRRHSDAAWMRKVDQLRADLAAANERAEKAEGAHLERLDEVVRVIGQRDAAQAGWREAVEEIRESLDVLDNAPDEWSTSELRAIVARYDAQGGKDAE